MAIRTRGIENMNQSNEPTGRWLRRYTKFVAASTLFLIYAGAMVTSTGSGLAVPDWPLSYGMLMPPMVGGIFYEHGHRMIAATVGLLVVIQAIWLQMREPKRFLRVLGWVSLGAVIIQGLLGGLTVILLLPKTVSISHAALAEIFLCVNVAIAFFASTSYASLQSRRGEAANHRIVTRVLVAAVFIQVLLGAFMRHLGAGLAIPDYPLSFGRIVPPLDTLEITSNFMHRLGAVAVLLLVVMAGFRIARDANPALIRVFRVLAGLVVIQITLGAFTVWSGRNDIITSFHVMTGAATLATTVLLALTASVLGSDASSRSHLRAREVAA